MHLVRSSVCLLFCLLPRPEKSEGIYRYVDTKKRRAGLLSGEEGKVSN